MLADLAGGSNSSTHEWLEKYSVNNAFTLGTRGEAMPVTDQVFDIPMLQENVNYITVVGRGGQGLMLLNSLIVGAMGMQDKYCSSMAAYGALQRGGGISTLHRRIPS